MKKMMILVNAIMMAVAANANPVETAAFDEVRVNVPARVRVVAGENYMVNVAARNEAVEDAVRCTVKDGVLCINARDLDRIVENEEPLYITIVTPTDPKLTTARDMEAINVRKNFAENVEMIAHNK